MSITWNGVSSDTIGVIVEKIPNRYVPTRRFSPQQVAGRNGNILLVDKAFPNVEQEYEVYLSAESQGLPSVARACAEWLMGPDGYCRLQDSYDTTVYREAFLLGGFDIENILNKFGRCTITFSCKPQKYLLTGDTPIVIPAGSTATYTGASVQFNGGAGASITSLAASITPTQDLHGYDHPWAAGGGVNLYDVDSVDWVETNAGQYGWGHTFTGAGTYAIKAYGDTSSAGAPTYMAFMCRIHYADDTWEQWDTGIINNPIKTLSAGDTLVIYAAWWQPSEAETIELAQTWQIQVAKSSTQPSQYYPYSNICPITGSTGLTVYVGPTQDPDDATEYTEDWTAQAGTVYSLSVDVVGGELTVDMANIPSYNGETINEPWMSSMDEYVAGTTPTTGAQVVYTLSTPVTYQLEPQTVDVLTGTNNVWASDGTISVTVSTPLGGFVTNPTPFEARPLLTVSGEGEIVINGKSIQILESVSDFEIDCEAMEAEDNSKIYCMDFPYLEGGENAIVGDGSITALTVVPRWWTL